MKIDYIIIQAGGEGTRLGSHTKNKPKGIVSVENLPIIFHLFCKYPDKKFIIIGDYKVDILDRYLKNFSKVQYMLLHSNKKGNVAGIKNALKLIPEKEAFMLIWSDLIIRDNLLFEEMEDCSYVGVTTQFSCSWSFCDGVLEKKNTDCFGVAGLFIFPQKNILEYLPEHGSFTKFLQTLDVDLKSIELVDINEIGTISSIERIDTKEQRCRPYNSINLLAHTVEKRGLTVEAQTFIQNEIDWFSYVKKLGYGGIPDILGTDPFTTVRIQGDNLFKWVLKDTEKELIIKMMKEKLDNLHTLQKGNVNFFDMYNEYYLKTLNRLDSISAVIPFSNIEKIRINGKMCKNILVNRENFRNQINYLLTSVEFGIIHGDCTFTNTLLDNDKELFFIDPRGYFGKTKYFGDIYYDWAKMYYSIYGKFDNFNVKKFTIDIDTDFVNFAIEENGWTPFTDYFLTLIENCDMKRIKMIHAIIWLSLASHCWEDFDSMCLAFYNGLYLLQEVEGFE